MEIKFPSEEKKYNFSKTRVPGYTDLSKSQNFMYPGTEGFENFKET